MLLCLLCGDGFWFDAVVHAVLFLFLALNVVIRGSVLPCGC